MNDTMKTKYKLQVRRYLPQQTSYGSEAIGKITGNFGRFELVDTVKRELRAKQVGNFNPLFCTYKGKERLVRSDGDLSDAFWREESYLKSLFITVN